MLLSFDTEVTGMPKPRLPLDDPSQPRIVQLGAVLVDENGQIVETFDRLIRPDGWHVPEEMAEIHGWTTEICAARGVPMKSALAEFTDLVRKARTVTAYNLEFDHQMLAIECLANELDDPLSEAENSFCAMRLCADLLRIPDGRGGHRFVRLQDAHQRLFGTDQEKPHCALADSIACSRIVFEARRAGIPIPGLPAAS